MRASCLALLVVAACGGKLAPVDEEPLPIVATPSPTTSTTSLPPLRPTADPLPTSTPPIPPPTFDASVPPPEPPPLNTKTWPCAAGAEVEMVYVIAAAHTGDGEQALCRGTVEFTDDLAAERGSMPDPDRPGVVRGFRFNGRSICPSWAPHLPGRSHCGNATFGNGRTEAQWCTIFAYCENGEARATGFSW